MSGPVRDDPGARTRPTSLGLGALARVAIPIFGALAALLGVFLAIGLFLPRHVEVTRSIELSAPPEAVFPYLSDLERWTAWTPWGDVESRIEGSPRGAGATRIWDDPAVGSGSLTLTEVAEPRRVTYEARVEGGLRFEGRLVLEPVGDGSNVTWTESVSWGWNPILGWTGLTLRDAQGRQLESSLSNLQGVVQELSSS